MWDYFTDMPVVVFLNTVTYYKRKQEAEQQAIRNAEKSRRI